MPSLRVKNIICGSCRTRPCWRITMRIDRRAFLGIGLAIFSTATLPAQPPAAPEKPQDPAYAKITDDPKLPRVLLIGDSISIGYTLPVRKQLKGTANVHRIPENGGPTTNGVAK